MVLVQPNGNGPRYFHLNLKGCFLKFHLVYLEHFLHLLLELYQSIECNLCSTNCFGEWTTQISKKEKGIISTNVQGVCDPNLKFIYVLPGWEGFISNGRVLRVVLCSRHSFHIPNDNNFYFLNNVSIMINLLVYYFYRYC